MRILTDPENKKMAHDKNCHHQTNYYDPGLFQNLMLPKIAKNP
jgi:hypothetical protein